MVERDKEQASNLPYSVLGMALRKKEVVKLKGCQTSWKTIFACRRVSRISLGLLKENKPGIHPFIRDSSLEMSFKLNNYLNIKQRCFMTETIPFYVNNICACAIEKSQKVTWAKVRLHAVRQAQDPALAVLDLSLLCLGLMITCTLGIIKA